MVHAVDVRTGKRSGSSIRKVDKSKGYRGCCDVVNRGVALYQGKVFVGAFDGRLIALDAATGQQVWEKDTIIDQSKAYTITGAPRVFKGKVIIGNGGAEYGVRGYITAYDAATGEQKWRWFTVPGDPSKPFEDASMAKAAKTWDPSGKYWEAGGGGTAWDTIAFDPELNLMYVGTGNGSPWARSKRSPKGGDNLYLASIVALNPDTGKYVWHYQETPGDNWDYTSTQPMILADLKIGGKARKVILHAPKNGFFFVIDRTNGKFISAKNFVDVNWATGYDKNGPADRDRGRAPEREAGREHSRALRRAQLAFDVVQPADRPGLPAGAEHPAEPDGQQGLEVQRERAGRAALPRWAGTSRCSSTSSRPRASPSAAWWPGTRSRRRRPGRVEHVSPWNGGTLTTAGNLVFQGTADGRSWPTTPRPATSSGRPLPAPASSRRRPPTWSTASSTSRSRWGGAASTAWRSAPPSRQGPGTVYTFVIGGTAPKPEFVQYRAGQAVAGREVRPGQGRRTAPLLYVSNCVFCHGVPGVDRGGNIPNLGYMAPAYIENLDKFVFKGPATERGMPDFTGKLNADDIEKIKAFIQGTADAIRPK